MFIKCIEFTRYGKTVTVLRCLPCTQKTMPGSSVHDQECSMSTDED